MKNITKITSALTAAFITASSFTVNVTAAEKEYPGITFIEKNLYDGVHNYVWLGYGELIEERRTDGSAVLRFAGEMKQIERVKSEVRPEYAGNFFMYVEGDEPYLLFKDYNTELGIIQNFDIHPRYYLDDNTVTLNEYSTDEVIADAHTYYAGTNRVEDAYYKKLPWEFIMGSYCCISIRFEDDLSYYYDVIYRGDINNDSKVDISDLTELSLSLVGDS